MRDTLVVVDPVPKGEGHSPAYNRSFLKIAVGSGHWEQVIFLSSSAICDRLKNGSLESEVKFRPWCKSANLDSHGKLVFGVRLIYNYIRGLLSVARAGGDLVFTHAEAITLGLTLTLVPRGWLQRFRVTLVDQLPGYARRRFPQKTLLSLVFRNLYGVIVFEEAFKETIEVPGSGPQARVSVMHTPHHWNLAGKGTQPRNLSLPRKVHYVGGLRRDKGMEMFPEALRRLTRHDGCGSQFALGVYGSMPRDLHQRLPSPQPGLAVENAFLDDDEYLEVLKAAHFVLLTHTEEFFPKVSGVLMDAIALQRPVVASNIDIMRYYFEEYGPMGILFREGDADDMVHAITESAAVTREEYRSWCSNMKDFSTDRSKRKLQRQLTGAMTE